MATRTADRNVIELESHPVWRSAHRYSRELSEAMRRHPSYLGHSAHDTASDEHHTEQVTALHSV